MFWLICYSTDSSRLQTHRVNSRSKDASMLLSKSFIRAVSLDDKQHHSICWIPSYIHAGNPSGSRNKMRILSLKSNGDISAKFRNLHLFFNLDRYFINALHFFFPSLMWLIWSWCIMVQAQRHCSRFKCCSELFPHSEVRTKQIAWSYKNMTMISCNVKTKR